MGGTNVGPSFSDQLDHHSQWRRAAHGKLKKLEAWLSSRDLMDSGIRSRIGLLEGHLRGERIMVAFVAEFSRGKSELINALFFADYGRRIMPASPGRTTMCPIELGYDSGLPNSLRLLPIETRLQQQSLDDWKLINDQWHEVDLDISHPDRLAAAMEMVAEVKKVDVNFARSIGFWDDNQKDDNPHLDDQGLVEVPRWRHAVINLPHPLLKQGLVIVDTPGLNAVGAEPALTVSLIPQAQVVVFVLGADTGVTRSDLSIWREHLAPASENSAGHFIVLNKIDTLWSELNSVEQIDLQTTRQCETSAAVLGVPRDAVIPVSAQKGLIAKIKHDDALLEASGLRKLEYALSTRVIQERDSMLRAVISSGLEQLRTDALRLINIRRRDLDDQVAELVSLKGKNFSVIGSMRSRIQHEFEEFEQSKKRVRAVKVAQGRQYKNIMILLGVGSLKEQFSELAEILQKQGLKLGVRKIYSQMFENLRYLVQRTQDHVQEIHEMLTVACRQLNAEYGFSLLVSPAPALQTFVDELRRVEENHVRYLGVRNSLKLVQKDFSEQLVRALASRVRSIFEIALHEIEAWSQSIDSQLDEQLRERRSSYERRIEAVDRIQSAATGLAERLQELDEAQRGLEELGGQLQQQINQFFINSGERQLVLSRSTDLPNSLGVTFS